MGWKKWRFLDCLSSVQHRLGVLGVPRDRPFAPNAGEGRRDVQAFGGAAFVATTSGTSPAAPTAARGCDLCLCSGEGVKKKKKAEDLFREVPPERCF